MKKINNSIFKYLFIIFIFLCLLYSIIKYILLQNLNYKNYIALNNIFSEKEIKDIQDCIGNKENINSCFEKHQSNILSKIKDKLNISYMSIGLARLSNNNNNDAQNYHRDIKISNNYKGEYPNIYTIICYFDDASLLMGNETINSKPGDIIIFNSTNLHKANNIQIFENKQRRVLQYFHVFFDENDKDEFYKNHSFCEHIDGTKMMKYLTYFVDVKFLFEYLNMSRFINYSNCNKLFSTNIKNDSYVTSIDGIKYYKYF
jgi:hypothetical protein